MNKPPLCLVILTAPSLLNSDLIELLPPLGGEVKVALEEGGPWVGAGMPLHFEFPGFHILEGRKVLPGNLNSFEAFNKIMSYGLKFTTPSPLYGMLPFK